MGILKDLDVGQNAEERIRNILKTMGFECTDNSEREKMSDYDIRVVSPEFTIEVKEDLYSAKSGNVAIEYWNSKSNKPSGITITKANIWCHIIAGEPFIIKTKTLKDFIDKVKPKRMLTGVGDGNADIMLYDCEVLKAVMVPLDNIRELI